MTAEPNDSARPGPGAPAPGGDTCDVCGSADVTWRKCKLVCLNCRSIVKSCADL